MQELDRISPRVTRTRAPHKRPNRAPAHRCAVRMRPIGQAHPEQDMTPLVQKILARIRKNRSNTGAGSWVLADGRGFAYVLTDHASNAGLLDAHSGLIVGRFDRVQFDPKSDKPGEFPAAGEMFDALVQQFIDVGFLTAAAIYDEVRRVEG